HTIVTYTEPTGTQHTFPPLNVSSPSSGCPTSANAFAADSSGYRIYRSQPTTTSLIQNIYAPDGTLVHIFNGPVDARVNYIQVVDNNGNYLSSTSTRGGGSLVDTLGRTLI